MTISDLWFYDIYNMIYMSLCLIGIFNFLIIKNGKRFSNKFTNSIILFYFSIIAIVFSMRDVTIGTDTGNYLYIFAQVSEMDIIGLGWEVLNKDAGFILLIKMVSILGDSFLLLLLACSLLYLWPIMYILINTKCDGKIFIVLSIVSMFFFLSLGINVIRQGIALSFMALAIYFNTKNLNYKFLFSVIISCLFHGSALIVLLLFLVSKKLLGLKVISVILLLSVLISLFSIGFIHKLGNIGFLSSIYESRLSNYVESDNIVGYKVGFRYDFFVFNMFFASCGFYLIKCKKHAINQLYICCFKTYLLLTAVFVLMFNFPYSDRFGVLSWVFIPYIISPFVSNSTLVKKAALPFIVLNVLLFIYF